MCNFVLILGLQMLFIPVQIGTNDAYVFISSFVNDALLTITCIIYCSPITNEYNIKMFLSNEKQSKF